MSSYIVETIWDIDYKSPPKPPKKEFLNYGFPKKDQKWQREDIQKELTKLSANKQYELINREYDRITNGVFILINGTETYLVGRFYFFLTYVKTQKGKYPEYRDVHRKFFTYFDYCYKHPTIVGLLMGKGRRFGATQIGVANCLYDGILNENWMVGLISKDFGSVKKIFARMLVYAFTSLPKILKPTVNGNDKPVDKYIFSEPAKRMTQNNTQVEESGGLNSYIICAPTNIRSFDGDAVNFLFLDEGGKWEECSVAEYYEIMKEVLKEGVEKIGFCYIPSTVADNEKKGGQEFKRLWDSSGDKTNSTGLKRLFMPAYEGFVGYLGPFGESIVDTPTKEQSIYLQKRLDELLKKVNGRVDDLDPDDLIDPTIGAKEFLSRRRLKYTDEGMRAEEIRQYPFSEKEMFLSKAGNCIYNVLHVNEQLMYIDDNQIIPRRGKFYRDIEDGKVKISFSPDGMWHFLWFPPIEESNDIKVVYGKKYPNNKHLYSIGCDPFASSEGAAYGSESDGVAYVYRRYNPTDPNNSGMFTARMNYRPRLKSLFHEQVMMCAEYHSCLANYEATISDFFDAFTEASMENFLVYCPDELRGRQSKILKAGTPATSKASIEFHTNALVSDFEKNYQKYYFKELLVQKLDFDPQDRTKFDEEMAAGYAIIGNHVCTVRNIVPEKIERKAIVKRYSIQR